MSAASLDLCRELYELSGWDGTDEGYGVQHIPDYQGDGAYDTEVTVPMDLFDGDDFKLEAPAYDLGYLLRKLPRSTEDDYRLTLQPVVYPQWCASYDEMDSGDTNLENHADTPEDAAAKLAIELFKQGILAKEDGEVRG